MLTVPRSPLPIRLLNAALAKLAKRGVARCRLDVDGLIRAAQEKTGLQDFGEGPFQGALRILVESLEAEAQLTPVGRFLTRETLVTALANQLQLQDWFTRHPEIAQEKITAPILIIGMPRTGTTILHELMALDPNNRVPLFWEVSEPFPPPQTQTYTSDPRIRHERMRLNVSHYLMPGVERMHRMDAQIPQECVKATADVFLSMLYNTIYRIPAYAKWLAEEADLAPAYRYHRRMHQLLQWRCPAQRWVLKSPGHLWSIEALLAEYPDARLIQTHRDPLKIVSSLTSMTSTMRSAFCRDVDLLELAREWSDCCAIALNASLRTRRSGAIAPQRILDIQFGEFMQDPAASVEKIYRTFDLDYTDALAQKIRSYIAQNPADKHGGHTHRFADTGLRYEEERAKVQDYQDYFGVKSEVSAQRG